MILFSFYNWKYLHQAEIQQNEFYQTQYLASIIFISEEKSMFW